MKRLLILGTGLMAARHAEEFSRLEGIAVDACCDVRPDAAEAFARLHGIPKVFTDLGQALGSGTIDAVVNTTPDAVHHPTTMQALRAGKAVFCEKPLATNANDAREMAKAAQEVGLVNGVNLTYRNVAALQAAQKLVAAGAIGEIRHFEASYLQSWLTQPAWGDWRTDAAWLWRLSTAHGSMGVLGDVGIHILDFLTFAAGADVTGIGARLKTFAKAPGDRIGAYQLDANDSAAMTAELANGATGVVHASRFASGHLNDLSLSLFGTEGGIRVTNKGELGTLDVSLGKDMPKAKWRKIRLEPVATNYAKFAAALIEGDRMNPDFAVAARLQEVIDGALEAHATGAWHRL